MCVPPKSQHPTPPAPLGDINIALWQTKIYTLTQMCCVFSPVALNFQTPGEQMDLNHGRFLQNGQCGYILKPPFMCQPDIKFNPENVGGGPGHQPVLLTVRVRWRQTCQEERKKERKKVCLCIRVSEQLDKLSLYSEVIKLSSVIIVFSDYFSSAAP